MTGKGLVLVEAEAIAVVWPGGMLYRQKLVPLALVGVLLDIQCFDMWDYCVLTLRKSSGCRHDNSVCSDRGRSSDKMRELSG